jgi:hypothetical protein
MMLKKCFISLFLILLLAVHASSHAQDDGAGTPVETGLVGGRVFCADTNLPARRASVGLILASNIEGLHSGNAEIPVTPGYGDLTKTSLDGSFLLSNVPVGTYYILISSAGYVPALAHLYPSQQSDLTKGNNPAGDWDAKPPASIQRIVVNAHQTSIVNVSIERGAAIGGTVRYDDGSPASGVLISVLIKSNGNWVYIHLNSFGDEDFHAVTDDRGHFRVSGLPTGKYLIEAESNAVGGYSSRSNDSIAVYSGGVTRKEDGVPVEIRADEELLGENIVIPSLTKLHFVRGHLVAAGDGHTLDEGSISILFPADHSVLAQTEIQEHEKEFIFPNVPEGDYILRVHSAAEYTEMQNPNEAAASNLVAAHAKHRDAITEQPIHVMGDITNLIVAVPDKGLLSSVKP